MHISPFKKISCLLFSLVFRLETLICILIKNRYFGEFYILFSCVAVDHTETDIRRFYNQARLYTVLYTFDQLSHVLNFQKTSKQKKRALSFFKGCSLCSEGAYVLYVTANSNGKDDGTTVINGLLKNYHKR